MDKLYHLTGLSGEVLRKTWHMPPEKFIEKECSPAKAYSYFLAQDLTHSAQTVIRSVFRSVCDKYGINDPNSIDIPQYLYHETRTRTHCGKTALVAYLKNSITIVPSWDPKITTLQLKSPKCPDYNLLMIFLFSRYAPDLLKIRFDKFHEAIDMENLVSYAQKINKRFPRHFLSDKDNWGGVFCLQPRDLQAEKILAEGKNNPDIPGGFPATCLKAAFDSGRTYGLFTTYFDEEIYHHAASHYESRNFWRDRLMYAVLSVARLLEAVEISQRNRPLYQGINHFLEQDFTIIHEDKQLPDKFKPYLTARVDVKFMSTAGDFQIVSASDEEAKIEKPGWFNKDGVGYVIQSYVGQLEFIAKAETDGKINLYLRGSDVRKPEDNSKRIPFWIDFTKLAVNDKIIFDKVTPAWHDKPYRYNLEVKAGEEIKIQVEWLPHRSET